MTLSLSFKSLTFGPSFVWKWTKSIQLSPLIPHSPPLPGSRPQTLVLGSRSALSIVRRFGKSWMRSCVELCSRTWSHWSECQQCRPYCRLISQPARPTAITADAATAYCSCLVVCMQSNASQCSVTLCRPILYIHLHSSKSTARKNNQTNKQTYTNKIHFSLHDLTM